LDTGPNVDGNFTRVARPTPTRQRNRQLVVA
jgi:hypothetical protein